MFKVGDKVKRIKNSDYSNWVDSLGGMEDPDGVYTVSDFSISSNDVYNWQPSITLAEIPNYWRASNFELAEQPKETTKMISLKDNHTALVNLGVTIRAIEQLDGLIAYYSEDKPGPAYVSFQHSQKHSGSEDIQIDRKIMLVALKEQRQRLVDYMATLGIDANN